MLKKFIFPILCLLFLCGCEATYNLDVSDGFLETTTINATNVNEYSLLEGYPRNIPAYYTDSFNPEDTEVYDDVSYYNVSYVGEGVLNYTYKFEDKYNLSTIVKESMTKVNITSDRTVRIHATGDFDCFNIYPALEKLTVNIKVPYEMVYNNADSINGDIYTWIINKDNPSGTIDIEYENPDYVSEIYKDINKDDNNSSSKEDNEKKSSNKKSSANSKKNNNTFVLVLSGLFFVALFGIIIFINKFKGSR